MEGGRGSPEQGGGGRPSGLGFDHEAAPDYEGNSRGHAAPYGTQRGPDSDKTILVFRTAKTAKGKQLALATQAPYENDTFARNGINYRNDYAPKGRELKALEDLLNKMQKR